MLGLLKSLPRQGFCGGKRFGCFVVAGVLACISQAPTVPQPWDGLPPQDETNARVLPFVVAASSRLPLQKTNKRLFDRAKHVQSCAWASFASYRMTR